MVKEKWGEETWPKNVWTIKITWTTNMKVDRTHMEGNAALNEVVKVDTTLAWPVKALHQEAIELVGESANWEQINGSVSWWLSGSSNQII